MFLLAKMSVSVKIVSVMLLVLLKDTSVTVIIAPKDYTDTS